MKSCWLRHNGYSDCLLFMAGWGMGPEPFTAIDFGRIDVFMTYDYSSLNDTVLVELLDRDKLHLLAWSMGVWVAAWLAQQGGIFSSLHFESSTAIGGTLRPVDDKQGIPVQVFEDMLQGLSAEKIDNFYFSMFDSRNEARDFFCRRPQRTCEALHEELKYLHELCHNSLEDMPDIYTHKIITGRDQIFPARSQLRAWGRQHCTVASLPHFPFYRQEKEKLLFLPTHP